MTSMLYQRSLEIEQRLEKVLSLVRQGGYSTPRMAEELDVSVPTISRAVCALRVRGHPIRAEKQSDSWSYVLAASLEIGEKTESDLVVARH